MAKSLNWNRFRAAISGIGGWKVADQVTQGARLNVIESSAAVPAIRRQN